MPHLELTDEQAAERIAAVLVDLDDAYPPGAYPTWGTHSHGCWRHPHHGLCLAARIRATLTGQETT